MKELNLYFAVPKTVTIGPAKTAMSFPSNISAFNSFSKNNYPLFLIDVCIRDHYISFATFENSALPMIDTDSIQQSIFF
jgi:hypothetical protein